jgi:hypothetical protein
VAPARRLLAVAGALCLASARAAAPAGAQVTVSLTLSGLQFGVLMPGVPTQIAPTDAARRAEVLLTGTGAVDLRFVLATVLTSADGTTLPLRFVNGDAAVLEGQKKNPDVFDPNVSYRLRFNPGGGGNTARVFLGGTASPSAAQPAGLYSATVSLVITSPNQ